MVPVLKELKVQGAPFTPALAAPSTVSTPVPASEKGVNVKRLTDYAACAG